MYYIYKISLPSPFLSSLHNKKVEYIHTDLGLFTVSINIFILPWEIICRQIQGTEHTSNDNQLMKDAILTHDHNSFTF